MSTCMHVDGEFCHLCYKPKQETQACVDKRETFPLFMTEAQAFLQLNAEFNKYKEFAEVRIFQLMQDVEYLRKLDKATSEMQFDFLKRLKILEDFAGQNYANDLSQIHTRLKSAEEILKFSDHDERINILEEMGIEMRLLNLEGQLIAPLRNVTKEEFRKEYPEITHEPNEDEPIEIQVKDMQLNIKCLFTSLKAIETEIGRIKIAVTENHAKKIPYKCPVCYGLRFSLQHDSNGGALSVCKPCEGKGIIWG